MNEITWTRKALKQLSRIHSAQVSPIRAGVQELRRFPGCANVKRLVNHKYSYRLRVGNYRVFFDFDGEVKVVSIEEVRKRDERTY